MKNILASSLKSSLEDERQAIKDRNYIAYDDKFAKADKAFGNKNQNTITVKVVRDTFTMPEDDHSLIDSCKTRLLNMHYNANKSEIVRAGLVLLSKLSDEEMVLALMQVQKVKLGRSKL